MLPVVPALVLPQTSFPRLADAVSAAQWNADTRGPLLSIGADSVRNPTGKSVALPIGMLEAVTAFDYQIVRCGSLSVVAPLYLPPAAPPRPAVAPGAPDPLVALIDLLNDSQLQKLGSPAGLGLAELSSEEQRALFDKVIPNPLRYLNATSSGNGYHATGMPAQVSDQARQAARLRVNRKTALTLLGPAEGARMRPRNDLGTTLAGTPVQVTATPEPSFVRERLSGNPDGLRAGPIRLPSRLKASALAFESPTLNAQVSLEGAGTVAELMERCQQATGIELYTELSYRDLPLQLRLAPGAKVRTGDVLKALCWSLGATFRQLAPLSAYVLVTDQEGLGAQVAREQLQKRALALKQEEEGQARRKRLALRNQGQFLPYAEGDILAQNASLRRQFETATPMKDGTGQLRGLVLPLKDVPPDLLAKVQGAVSYEKKRSQNIEQFRLSRGLPPLENSSPSDSAPELLQLSTQYVGEVLVSGTGAIELYRTGVALNFELDGEAYLPLFSPVPRTTPFVLTKAQGAHSAVLAAPKTATEAQALVAAVARQGITTLWIEVDQDLAPLDAALAAGKEKQVAIGATLKLLRSTVPTLPREARDLTVLGEDTATWLQRERGQNRWWTEYGDSPAAWLVPSGTTARATLQARLAALTPRKGLACLALLDTSPLGYSVEDFDGDFEGSQFGYTAEARLAYLRQYHRDPIDLVRASGGADLIRPWNTLRRDARNRFLSDAFALIKSPFPGLPLYFRGSLTDWFGSWDAADHVPEPQTRRVSGEPADRQARSEQAHERSKLALRPVTFHPNALSTPSSRGTRPSPLLPDGPEALAYLLHAALADDTLLAAKAPSWDGFVIDLRFVAPDQVAKLLPGVVVEKPGKL